MKKRYLLFILMGIILIPWNAVGSIPGKYKVIPPFSIPKANSYKKVKIYEVFAFYCKHCYDFISIVEPKLKKKYGDRIEIIHYSKGSISNYPGKLYYIANQKGKGDQAMRTIFEMIHKQGLNSKVVYSKKGTKMIAKLLGLEQDFQALENSFGIEARVKEGIDFADCRHISHVPTVVIEGSIIPKREFSNICNIVDSLLLKTNK